MKSEMIGKIVVISIIFWSFNSFSQGVGSDLYSIMKTYKNFGIDTIRFDDGLLVATFMDESGNTTFSFDRNNICKTLLIKPSTKESLNFNIKVFDANHKKVGTGHWINYGETFNVHIYLKTMKNGSQYFEITK